MSRSVSLLLAGILTVSGVALVHAPAGAQQTAAKASTQKAAVTLPAKLGLGRPALPEEVRAWDDDVRPDGVGLPKGRGTAKQGDEIFQEKCASCHGEFGQGVGRWPVLSGGLGTLTADRPDKTVGSFWPDATTAFDYIQRAMPLGNARSLASDEVYALVAYILSMSDVIKDENYELNESNLAKVKMPNAGGFFVDDRDVSEKHFWQRDPCMKNCRPPPKVIGRAMSVDVTPDSKAGPKVD
ncbi:MAG: cytochrome c [Tardiphaga sp.]|uniref:c-type cytochrome n=1 Tax=Tardiphaga sp. TaxID=1926292 RepID=UPI0019895362|nr:cytochrome c [Tardiphaga sp.]MBC7586344.1 cytochrome c [Tardiphaga sp.]